MIIPTSNDVVLEVVIPKKGKKLICEVVEPKQKKDITEASIAN
jgi:hypothetical protein